MKKVIMVHGWGGNSKQGWFMPLRKELEKENFEVIAPEMPDIFNPRIKEWTLKLNDISSDVNENLYFIGHSMGCQAIMRFLEKLKGNKKIGGAVFIAGWFNLTDKTWDKTYTKKIADEWINTPINFGNVKKHVKKIFAIFSDDDPYVPLSDSKLFSDNLNADIMIIKNREHIEELNKDEMKKVVEFIKT